MNRFWTNIILPIIKSVNANYIIEVGSDTGVNTKNILEYCMDKDAHMAAIDPFPGFDVDEFKSKYGDKFEIYTELSLSRLPLLEDYDVILLDGDHNWYTLYNELKIIEKSFKNKEFPVIFLHDIGWPYARRDLYYNPEDIPEVYRQPYKKLGMYPGQKDLKEQGGLNSHLNNAIYENNSKNGVLTAVEDFIRESDLQFSFNFINAFHGLGILFIKNHEIENTVKKVIESAKLLDMLEEKRLHVSIERNELKSKNDSLRKKISEDVEEIEHMKNRLEQTEYQLDETKNQLSQTKKELKQKVIQFKELNRQITDLSAGFFELEYLNNKNRSISQRLISKFPSLFILLKGKTNLKNSLINIKGYNAIKKNNLFDIGYYLKNNKNVRLSGMDPILHYMYHGFKEGKKPSLSFDSKYYLKKYKDVKKSNLNPLIHYGLYGINEGRKTIKKTKTQMELPYYVQSDSKSRRVKTKNPKISVISAIYNKEESLYEYVDAFANQTYPGKIELVLVDDVSTDNSIDVIKCLQEIYENKANFEIRIIKNYRNLGNCGSRNKGISAAYGDIFVVIDADCIVNNDFLNEHYKAHGRGYDVCIGPMGIESRNRDIKLLHAKLRNNKKMLKKETKIQYPKEPTGFMNCVTRNFSITREFTEKINNPLFDESFSYSKDVESGFGCEDIEM